MQPSRIAVCASALAILLCSVAIAEPASPADFPTLPLPPRIDGLIGLPQTFTGGRREYLDLVTRAAEQAGLPPAVADAVAHVESRYDPSAFGGVGEIGLMQVRPKRQLCSAMPAACRRYSFLR